jgi:hypothetical protein
MIYRAFYNGEYIMFEFEGRPLGLIRAKRELDTQHLMDRYRTDLDKVMDDYDFETFLKGFIRWLTHIKKSAEEIDINTKVEMNRVCFSKSHPPLYFLIMRRIRK